jgi:opacity protein-like surface antigen
MRIFCATSALLLLPLCSQANHFEIPVMGGVTWSDPSNNRSVEVSSSPLLINDYLTDKTTRAGYLTGLGLNYSFDHPTEAPFSYLIGLVGYFVDFGEVAGLKLPLANIGSFDTLNYRYRLKSTSLMLESKMLYTKYRFQPYGFFGLGVGKNRAYDYKEKPTDPTGSAVADPYPFRSKTTTSLAYELGLGVQYQIADYPQNHLHYLLSLDYRYLNYGSPELGSMANETTRDTLEVSSLHAQAIVLSITTLF